MQQIYDLIVKFIKEERDQLESKESNYFALVFGEVSKYYKYLSIVWPRYKAISKTYVQGGRQKMARAMSMPAGSREVTQEEIREFELSREQQEQLHFELESIFIFCSILLDRIAASTQYYFGIGSKQWRSFEAMKDHFEGYCENKALSVPIKEMVQVIRWLHKNVSEFRHLLVAHKHENDYRIRLSFGTSWSNISDDDEAYFNLGLMYPQGNEEPFVSEQPQNILKNLNKLLELWIEYLRVNRGKRDLSPNA